MPDLVEAEFCGGVFHGLGVWRNEDLDTHGFTAGEPDGFGEESPTRIWRPVDLRDVNGVPPGVETDESQEILGVRAAVL